MIFRDRIAVSCRERRFVAGTAKLKEVFKGTVPGKVTFVDSSGSPNTVSSRLRIYLKPFKYEIKPNTSTDIVLSWGPWKNLIPDGAVELIYKNGRLSHYEFLAKRV